MVEKVLSSFGGKGDGSFDNTNAFKSAFEEIAKNGGGRLIIEEGVWRTSGIDIPSDTELHLKKGALLSFIEDPMMYEPVFTRWEGVDCYAMHSLIRSENQTNVSITGEGIVEGNGSFWWDLRNKKRAAGQKSPVEEYEKRLASLNPGYENQPGGGGGRENQFLRPCLVEFNKCTDVLIEGVTFRNSPFWTIHPLYSNWVRLNGVTIENPADAPNTDGIDIDSCTNVVIENCTVSVGDDGICLKSGSGEDGIKAAKPTENVLVKNCTVKNAHGGIVIGSETAAGIRHVLAENSYFPKTDRGIRIKSRRGRGGEIFDIHLRNLIMQDNLCPITVNMFYKCGITDKNSPLFSLEKQAVTAETPYIHDITIEGVKATGCKASAGFIAGLAERTIDNLVIKDCEFTTDESSEKSPMESDMFYGLPEVSEKSFRVINAPNAVFKSVSIKGPKDIFIYE